MTALRGSSSYPTARVESSSLTNTRDADPKIEEKRVQHHFMCIVVIFVACFAPLNILSKVVHPGIQETYDISAYIDKLFIVFAIIAFLPTIITPLIVFSLLMNEEDKVLLKDYFKLARRNRRNVVFELEENNFNNVAYIIHPSASTISTEVDAHQTHPLFNGVKK